MLKSQGSAGRLQKCIDDVAQFNKDHNIEHEQAENFVNVIYNSLCISGEAGEVANAAKKLWRDGNSAERQANLEEEIIDVAIYLCMLVMTTGMDFDKAWEAKHVELYERWQNGKKGQRVESLSHQ